MSSQHILDPALLAWFSAAALWRLWCGWDGIPASHHRSNLRTSPAARRRGCRCAPPLWGIPAPLPPVSQWSGRNSDPTLLGTSTLQLCCLCSTRVDSVQVRAADKAPPQPRWQSRVSFRECLRVEQGWWVPIAHDKTIQQKSQTSQKRKRCWLGIFQVIWSRFSNESSHVAPLPRVTWWSRLCLLMKTVRSQSRARGAGGGVLFKKIHN